MRGVTGTSWHAVPDTMLACWLLESVSTAEFLHQASNVSDAVCSNRKHCAKRKLEQDQVVPSCTRYHMLMHADVCYPVLKCF